MMLRGVGVLSLTLGIAAAGGAQDAPAPEVGWLRARAELMAREAARTAAVADSARERSRSFGGDTVRLDSLVVVVSRGYGKLVAAGVREAELRAAALLGSSIGYWRSDTLRLAFGDTMARVVDVVRMAADSDPVDIAHSVLGFVQTAAPSSGSRELRSFETIRLHKDSASLFRAAYIELIGAPPGAATRCADGSTQDCAIALGLMVPADPVRAIWDSVGRRETVSREGPRWNAPRFRPFRVRCLEDGEDASCGQFIHAVFFDAESATASRDWAPLRTVGREALLVTAVKLGGPGGFQRLNSDSTASLVAAIESAAGRPVDEVVSVWLRAVRDARPDTGRQRRERFAAALWSLIFAAGALGGATWRTT